MKIAMIASEVVPFAKTGGLADVAGALPLVLEDCGQDVIIIMPRYKCVTSGKFKLSRVSKDVSNATIGKNIKVYFIENDLYFNRDGLYVDKNGDYKDNLDRFSYFCTRALDLLKEINFSRPSIRMSGGIPPELISRRDNRLLNIDAYLYAARIAGLPAPQVALASIAILSGRHPHPASAFFRRASRLDLGHPFPFLK